MDMLYELLQAEARYLRVKMSNLENIEAVADVISNITDGFI